MRKNIRNDRRVEKTRNVIINAFKEMIIEKDFNEITIKELAERANINRKTFYLHYESMEEILFDVTVELSEQVFESLNNKGFFNGFFSIISVFILSCLIFYQTIITLILPFRFNIFILLIEIFLLFFILYRIIWPY